MSEKNTTTHSMKDKLGSKKSAKPEKAPSPEAEDASDMSDMSDEVEENDNERNIEQDEKELSEKEKALREAQDKVLRTYAEIDNIRRRAERDVANAHKYALEKFVRELLPVIDSLEHALKHAANADDAKAIHEGIEMTMTMFLGALEKFGVKQINPLNERFNPEYHEAMSMTENAEVESDTIIDVFQKGYLLNGRLVRPARVIVAK